MCVQEIPESEVRDFGDTNEFSAGKVAVFSSRKFSLNSLPLWHCPDPFTVK